jgi:indolepyruvate ferredoxin oxidoreductase
LDSIQREFRGIPGTTIIIYDQTCATEKRRRRKRGTLVDPQRRVFINEMVCEGCGDCSAQSNCISVEPLETAFGRKRQINQSSCNKDFSCVNGFCPSFVTVLGGRLRKPQAKLASVAPAPSWPILPEPQPVLRPLAVGQVWGIVVAGIGGTGVVTIGQLLGVAAHLEGKGIVTQDAGGLAQKGGAAWSHVLIGASQDDIRTTRVAMASADLVIACDPVVAAAPETLSRMRAGRTHVALNTNAAPTAGFVGNPDWVNPGQDCAAAIAVAVGSDALARFDADALALRCLGDSIYTNPMILGFAWQRGWIPLRRASLMRAIELNAVAVESNKAAFEWGRRAAHDESTDGLALAVPKAVIWMPQSRQSLDEAIACRSEFLSRYQNAGYASSYQEFVAEVRQAEEKIAVAPGLRLTAAVASGLFRLMAYKDEYEVARLHSDTQFLDRLQSQFEGDFKLQFHLAPPLLGRRNGRGELTKMNFGPWVQVLFRALAAARFLRATPLDLFGYGAERRQERALPGQYRQALAEMLPKLSPASLAPAVAFAQLPEQIRGFGHVKARHLVSVLARWQALREEFDQAAARSPT